MSFYHFRFLRETVIISHLWWIHSILLRPDMSRSSLSTRAIPAWGWSYMGAILERWVWLRRRGEGCSTSSAPPPTVHPNSKLKEAGWIKNPELVTFMHLCPHMTVGVIQIPTPIKILACALWRKSLFQVILNSLLNLLSFTGLQVMRLRNRPFHRTKFAGAWIEIE